jgi:hypothetical protein
VVTITILSVSCGSVPHKVRLCAFLISLSANALIAGGALLMAGASSVLWSESDDLIACGAPASKRS